jgi:hypothetical protein
MRQTVSNAQGADVLVLSKRSNESVATLDLYQAKHYNNLPSCMSDAVVGAFASLGAAYDKDKKSFDLQPKLGLLATVPWGQKNLLMSSPKHSV